MVVASKIMTELDVKRFIRKLENAEKNFTNRKRLENKILQEYEKNMNLIGITAVEDLLQHNVRDCINHIREAEIKGKL